MTIVRGNRRVVGTADGLSGRRFVRIAGGMVKVQLLALIGALTIVSAACTPSAVEPMAPTETEATSTSTSTSAVSVPDVATSGGASEFDAFVGRVAGDLLRLEPQTITELGATYILGRFDSKLDDPPRPRRRRDSGACIDRQTAGRRSHRRSGRDRSNHQVASRGSVGDGSFR